MHKDAKRVIAALMAYDEYLVDIAPTVFNRIEAMRQALEAARAKEAEMSTQ